MTNKQFAFSHGHWFDTWNEVRDDHPDFNIPDAEMYGHQQLLGVCGCISEEVAAQVAAYLDSIETDGLLHLTDSNLLGAIVADQAGLTQHSTSLRVCTITLAGWRWIELYRQHPSAP